jgi:hypothetical protein
MKKYLTLIVVIFALSNCSKNQTSPIHFLGTWYTDSTQVKLYNGNTLSSSFSLIFNHSNNALIYNFITDNTGTLTEPPSVTTSSKSVSINFTYTTTNNGYIYNKYDTGEIDTLQILVNTASNFDFQVKKHAPNLLISTTYCTK